MKVCRAPERPEMEQAQFDTLRTKTLEVHDRLVRVFGTPSRTGHLDPVSELVSAILSQNTSDVNRDRAYRRLRTRLPTWEAVRDADVREVREAIHPAGLSEIKAPRIQEALRRITQPDGHPSLDFLRHMNVEEARNWLMGIKGVGPKTASIILLFSMGRPAFPVDTHIHRVTRRLALIGPRASREQAHDILERLVPPELYYPFHINVIRHGREVCRPQPRCEVCVLRDLCCYYAACVQGTPTGEEKSAVCETGS